MDATPKPMQNAVVVGHITLTPNEHKQATKRPVQQPRRDEPRGKRQERPLNPREANAAQMAELQYLKKQILSFRADLGNYDNLRVAVAKLLDVAKVRLAAKPETDLDRALMDVKGVFTDL